MDGVGDEVLSGAALSGEQDRRRLHVLESPEHLEELPHGGRLTDDRGVAAGAALAQVVDLCRQAVGLQPLLDRQGDLAQVEGLREVAVRSELRRRDRAVDRMSSSPPMRGIFRSVSTRSGACSSTRWSPSLPSRASITR